MTVDSDKLDARATDASALSEQLSEAAMVADGTTDDPDAFEALPNTVLSLAVQYRSLSDGLFGIAQDMQVEAAQNADTGHA